MSRSAIGGNEFMRAPCVCCVGIIAARREAIASGGAARLPRGTRNRTMRVLIDTRAHGPPARPHDDDGASDERTRDDGIRRDRRGCRPGRPVLRDPPQAAPARYIY